MELEKRGYRKHFDASNGRPLFVYTGHLGDFFIYNESLETNPNCETTLAELKNME